MSKGKTPASDSLADIRKVLTKRQDVQTLHAIGQGCRSVTYCAEDGGVVCTMPGKPGKREVRVFPRHTHKAPTVFRAWCLAAGVALAYALVTVSFSGVDGPSNVLGLCAASGFWLGCTSAWPRLTERRHRGMDALAGAAAMFGMRELYAEERGGSDRGERTRGGVK